jgi:hypothetical protein
MQYIKAKFFSCDSLKAVKIHKIGTQKFISNEISGTVKIITT